MGAGTSRLPTSGRPIRSTLYTQSLYTLHSIAVHCPRQRSLHFWQSHVYGGQSAYGYSTVTNTVTTPQRGASNLDVTGRGSVESSCSAHSTHQHTLAGPTNTPSHQHTLEGDQQGHRMAAHNHFHQMRGAQMRVQCIPGEQTREPPHDGRAGTREWKH